MGQSIDFLCPNPTAVSGSSSATGTVIAATSFARVNTHRAGILRLSGTWVGSVLVQASVDGTNFYTVPVALVKGTMATHESVTANGFYVFNYVGDYLKVTWTRTSGTVSASVQLQALPYPLRPSAAVYSKLDLSNTKDEVKSTGGVITHIDWYNAGNATGFLQVFNKAAADVTVGSTTPDLVLVAATVTSVRFVPTVPLSFTTGITVAAATSATGSSALSAAGQINIGYR